MKKIIFGFLVLVFAASSTNSFAQLDDKQNNSKNFRFGLQIDPGISWFNISNKKKFASSGASVGFGWGAAMEFRLNEITSLKTGVRISYEGGKIDFNSSDASGSDSTFYLLNSDEQFITPDTASIGNSNNKYYYLKNRRYKLSYVNIPIYVKMKTKEIGYLTYFGQFGANIGIKTKGRANDEAEEIPAYTATDNNALNLKNGVQPIRLGISIGGGAEYNFSGSTSLVFGLTYDHYFTNALKSKDQYLRRLATDGVTLEEIEQKATLGGIRISVGILF